MVVFLFKRLKAILSVGKLRYRVEEGNTVIAEAAKAREVRRMILEGGIHDSAFVDLVFPEGDADLREEYGKMGDRLSSENLSLPRPIKRLLKPVSYYADLTMVFLGIPLLLAILIAMGDIIFVLGMGMEFWQGTLLSLLLLPMVFLFPPYTGGSIIPGIVSWVIIGLCLFVSPSAIAEIPDAFQRFIVLFLIAPPSIAGASLLVGVTSWFVSAFPLSMMIGAIIGLFVRTLFSKIPKSFYK